MEASHTILRALLTLARQMEEILNTLAKSKCKGSAPLRCTFSKGIFQKYRSECSQEQSFVYSLRSLLLWKKLFQVWEVLSKNWFQFGCLKCTYQACKNSRFAHIEETFPFTTSWSCTCDAEATGTWFSCRI